MHTKHGVYPIPCSGPLSRLLLAVASRRCSVGPSATITALPNKVSESGHKKSRENSWKKLPTIISASLS